MCMHAWNVNCLHIIIPAYHIAYSYNSIRLHHKCHISSNIYGSINRDSCYFTYIHQLKCLRKLVVITAKVDYTIPYDTETEAPLCACLLLIVPEVLKRS